MSRSLSLAIYLATRARRDRSAGAKSLSGGEKALAAERSGTASHPRPNGPVIWFHTGQDAQATAVREFVQRLLGEREDLSILLTTSAETRLESTPVLLSQLVPDEDLTAIRAFLDYWKPNLSVWTEPDPRPALATETARRRIPLLLADTGTSQPDPQGRRWWRGPSGTVLKDFCKVLTGTEATAGALRRLGARPDAIEIRGFLQEGTPALPYRDGDRAALAHEIGSRPVWLAAQVSLAERTEIAAAHRQAERRAHRLLQVLVPENISDGLAWTRDLADQGFSVALRSAGQKPHSQTQIYIADTEGEMGLWYRLAPISFLGQSLEPKGGINPFEAAALGSAILHGPHVEAHGKAYHRLHSFGAARLVTSAAELGNGVEALLAPDLAASMAHAAWGVCSAGADVTDRVLDLILTYLETREIA